MASQRLVENQSAPIIDSNTCTDHKTFYCDQGSSCHGESGQLPGVVETLNAAPVPAKSRVANNETPQQPRANGFASSRQLRPRANRQKQVGSQKAAPPKRTADEPLPGVVKKKQRVRGAPIQPLPSHGAETPCPPPNKGRRGTGQASNGRRRRHQVAADAGTPAQESEKPTGRRRRGAPQVSKTQPLTPPRMKETQLVKSPQLVVTTSFRDGSPISFPHFNEDGTLKSPLLFQSWEWTE